MIESGYERWIGRSETRTDTAVETPVLALAALLNEDVTIRSDAIVPPLGHWLYFLPTERRSALGEDGHPRRDAGSLLPPIPLPRRMWAGGRLWFHGDLPLGATMERRSTVQAITPKQGRSGELVFVTLRHEIGVAGRLFIEEEQDLVYRKAAARRVDRTRQAAPPPPGTLRRSLGVVDLFRYSALTFNAHRIHYDRDYARDVEGYPDLVVHGPLLATIALRQWSAARPDRKVRRFAFKSEGPLFVDDSFDVLVQDSGVHLRGADGSPLLQAQVS